MTTDDGAAPGPMGAHAPIAWRGDGFATLGNTFYTRVEPTPLPEPCWVARDPQVAALLGLPYAFASHFAPGELDHALGVAKARSDNLLDITRDDFPLDGLVPKLAEIERALIAGYRSQRALPETAVALLPLFLVLRSLTYIGWSSERPEMPGAADRLVRAVEESLELAGRLDRGP